MFFSEAAQSSHEWAPRSCRRGCGTLFKANILTEVYSVSLFSRLRAVVSGDDYLDGDFDD